MSRPSATTGNAAIVHDGLPQGRWSFAAAVYKLPLAQPRTEFAAKKSVTDGLVFPLKAGNKPSKDG
jgi:hypothetical protein